MYANGILSFYYFPTLAEFEMGAIEVLMLCLYALYLIMPIVIMVGNEVYWKVKMGVIN